MPNTRSLWIKIAAVLIIVLLGQGAGLLVGQAFAQWKYDVTLTGYKEARWKSLTSYIDKPALGDVTGDGIPEIIATSLFGDVFCVDGATGQILWAYEDEHSFDLALYICPAVVDVNCDKVLDVISLTPQGNVICLDGRSGRKIWSHRADAPIIFSPTAFDLNRDGTPEIAVVDVKGNIYLLSNAGALLWKATSEVSLYGAAAMGVIEEQPAVIVADRGGALRALDGFSGKQIWRYAPTASPVSTSPLVFRDANDPAVPWKVLFGSEAGDVFLANARTGAAVWTRHMAPREIIGDFALGDIIGDQTMAVVFSTSGSRIIAAGMDGGKQIWERKFKAPVREFLAGRSRKKVTRDVLAGAPVLADLDGDGHLDVVVNIRGLNNYIFGMRGADGKDLWSYGNRNLAINPALSESTVLACCMDEYPLGTYTTSVPAYSQPTPVVADFDGDGKADLIVNDRDEVGLISVPISFPIARGTWAKYVADSCNNMIHFSLPCLGAAPAPKITMTLEPGKIFKGESARLCWKTSYGGDIEIDQGIGVVAPENCLEVRPSENVTWRAQARGCGGEGREEITLQVLLPPAAPPATVSESTDPWALEDVYFEYDWYRLTPEAKKTLDENARKLKAHPGARVALEATCDERGSAVYNRYLSIARSEAVRDYLIEHGVEESRMEIRPQGETVKWDPSPSDQGWAQNRRVHFVILPSSVPAKP